jgi:hypothetical protein
MGRSILAATCRWIVLVFSLGIATAQTPPPATTSAGAAKSAAQEPPAVVAPLPGKLKGGVHFINPLSARHAFNPLELEIASQNAAGEFTGTFTRLVAFAGAVTCIEFRKVPMSGTYDGKKLVINVRASAKLECPDFTWEFGRGKEHDFEGASADGAERYYFDRAA